MDGTLVDSEPYWMAAETELVEAHGGRWTREDGLAMVGNSLEVSAQILRTAGVDLEELAIITFLVEQVRAEVSDRVPWQPGALELLDLLVQQGIPSALVTMSWRRLAEPVIAGAPPGVFGALVCGDDVTHGKPHPESYLKAAERLGADITRCVAIEDSPAGIASALAAGARTIGVQVMVPVPPVPGLSRVGALTDVDLELIGRVAAGEVVDLLGT